MYGKFVKPLNVSMSTSHIGFDNSTLHINLHDDFYLLAGHIHFMMTDWQDGNGYTNGDASIASIIRRPEGSVT